MSLVDKIRKKTRLDLENKLDKYGKCALVRCTGFGKTWLLADITKKYEKVLYLYPSEVVKNIVKNVLDKAEQLETINIKKKLLSDCDKFDFNNIKFMTYMKLIRLSDEELDSLKEYDLIIFDECHRIGGKITKEYVGKLFRICKDSKFIGSTATPDRNDAFDIIETFFNNIVVYPYTLHDAFQDNIIKKPYYCYCTYDIETDLKEAALLAGQDINNIKVKEVLNSKLIEISNIYNMETIIRQVVKKYVKDTSYLKFIVFFDGFKQLNNKSADVVDWFQKAFKKHSIKTLTISSRTTEESNNVKKLNSLVKRKKGIDLIFCVDMLNMGYHVEDLTGIVMYRGTSSSIIYTQQLGRALSTGKSDACIVFDVVDNLHRKCIYELYDKTKVSLRKRKTLKKTDNPENIYLTNTGTKEIAEIREELKQDNIRNDISEQWWKFCNVIEPEDLIATGNEATYRELIAKAVAEPISLRCKRAQEEHYRCWCKYNNLPYPMTKEELADTELVPPISIYAGWQNVTVNQILNEIENNKNWYSDLQKRVKEDI